MHKYRNNINKYKPQVRQKSLVTNHLVLPKVRVVDATTLYQRTVSLSHFESAPIFQVDVVLRDNDFEGNLGSGDKLEVFASAISMHYLDVLVDGSIESLHRACFNVRQVWGVAGVILLKCKCLALEQLPR